MNADDHIGCENLHTVMFFLFFPLPNATVEETVDLLAQCMIVCRQA